MIQLEAMPFINFDQYLQTLTPIEAFIKNKYIDSTSVTSKTNKNGYNTSKYWLHKLFLILIQKKKVIHLILIPFGYLFLMTIPSPLP